MVVLCSICPGPSIGTSSYLGCEAARQARQAYIWVYVMMSCSFPRCRCGTELLSDFNWSLSRWHDTAQLQYPQSLSNTLHSLHSTLHTELEIFQKHKTPDYVTRDCCCDAWLRCCHDNVMISCHDGIKYWSLVEPGVSRANSGNWNKKQFRNIYGWSRNSCNCDLPFSRVEGSADLVS